jgi:hypothetical protein
MAIVNITTSNDADFYRVFQYVTVDGFPVSLIGSSLEMMLRRNADDAAAVLRLASDTGDFVMVDALQGTFSLLITQNALEHLATGDFVHSNIMTRDDGMKVRLWSGTFTNNAGPTR